MKIAILGLLALGTLSCATTTTRTAAPCSLLTAADLGQTPVEIKDSGRACFYRMEPFNDSVSLSLLPNVPEIWEKKESHVREVRGLGDDALYSNLPVGAMLYVRSGDTMLRISVGGQMSDEERLAKSVRLAKAALARMR